MPAVPAPPDTPALELERLKRSVRSRLFAHDEEAIRIGRFRILGQLGQGGMGIVYAAQDDELDRKVALKLLRPELSTGLGARRLAGEAKSLAQLSHPNVVSVFDVGEHEGQRFIAMEYVEGQTLREWLQTRRQLADVLEVFIAAGRGLAAAHAVGLVHRDFKPDNVLVGNDGRPRVLDFGLARPPNNTSAAGPPRLDGVTDPLATSLTADGTVLGTPAFMAPEQHLGEPADGRTDQFAFCVALYQALYGEMPFRGADLRTLSLAVVRGRLPMPRQDSPVPPELRDILVRGLQVDPNRRFAAMDDLLGNLETVRLSATGAPTATLLDTQQVERVFGEVARYESAALEHPGLSATEVVRIASEAGLDPELSRRAIARVTRPATTEARSAPSRSPGAPPERRSLGYQTVIGLNRTVYGPLPSHAASAVIRELERELGEEGHAEWIGASLVWTSRTADARLDPTADGRIDIRLRRDRSADVARRRRRVMLALSGAMFLLGTVIADVAGLYDLAFVVGLENALVGAAAGFFGLRKLHNAGIQHDREQLEYVSERIESLLVSTPPRAIEAGR